jgi:hypothetical protein
VPYTPSQAGPDSEEPSYGAEENHCGRLRHHAELIKLAAAKIGVEVSSQEVVRAERHWQLVRCGQHFGGEHESRRKDPKEARVVILDSQMARNGPREDALIE